MFGNPRIYCDGSDPELWSDRDRGRQYYQYCPTSAQIDLLAAAIEHRLEAYDIGPRNRLRIRTCLYSDSGFAWSYLRCFVRYDLIGVGHVAICSGLSRSVVVGPAGPHWRLKASLMADAGLPLCGRDIAEQLVNELEKQRGALPSDGNASYGLPVWIGLTYGATRDGSTARVLTPAHYLAPSGECYDLDRKHIEGISQIGGTTFVMSDREKPTSSRGVLNE